MPYEAMTKEQFHIQLERLSNFFGQTKVTRQFVERVWNHVNNLPYYNFQRIIDNVLDGSRYLPTPKEFADLAKLERGSIKNPHPEESTPIDCDKCGDTGFTWVNSFHGNPVWMFCACEVGEKRVKEKNYRLMKYLPQLGNIHRKFPTEYFIPPRINLRNKTSDEVSAMQFEFVSNRMRDFQSDLRDSEKYWLSVSRGNE